MENRLGSVSEIHMSLPPPVLELKVRASTASYPYFNNPQNPTCKSRKVKPYPLKAEVRGHISRSSPSLEEAGQQAGECRNQQGRQGQSQQLSWGVGPEHLAVS